jgi:hypothetical protein
VTIQITFEKIKDLHRRGLRYYSNWLSAGISAFNVERRGRESFPGAENYIGWRETLEEDLAAIYDALDVLDQSEFRLALATALGELRLDEENYVVSVTLLRLSALIGASEVVDVLPSLISQARGLNEQLAAKVSLSVCNIAIELAVPTPASARAMNLLISSAGFRTEIAPLALLALCKSMPYGFASHLNVLGTNLNARFAGSAPDESTIAQRDELIVAVADLVPAYALAEAFAPNVRRKTGSSAWVISDWFCRGLVESKHPRVVELAREVGRWADHYLPSEPGPSGGMWGSASAFDWSGSTSSQDEFSEALGQLEAA